MRQRGFYIIALIALGLPILFPKSYFVEVNGTAIFFNAALAIGLNLLMGYAGQVSLGHAAFFAIGAYSTAILTTRYGLSPYWAMLAGFFLNICVSYILAKPLLKLKGHYLAMATLGMGIIVHILLVQTGKLTGGPDGISNIPNLSIFGFILNTDRKWYWAAAILMLMTLKISLNIADSRMGRAFRALHTSEIAAQMMRIDTTSAKTQVFVLSALIASLTGSMFAHQKAFVSPDSFTFFFSIELVTMVVLGGLGSTYGALFGAAFITLLPELLSSIENYEVMIFGLILMTTMMFFPKGLYVTLIEIFRTQLGVKMALNSWVNSKRIHRC